MMFIHAPWLNCCIFLLLFLSIARKDYINSNTRPRKGKKGMCTKRIDTPREERERKKPKKKISDMFALNVCNVHANHICVCLFAVDSHLFVAELVSFISAFCSIMLLWLCYLNVASAIFNRISKQIHDQKKMRATNTKHDTNGFFGPFFTNAFSLAHSKQRQR